MLIAQLPADFPPWETVYAYFAAWTKCGTLARLQDAPRDQLREAAGRKASAAAGVVDAQAVKGADTLGTLTRGFDAGKRANGRKRHIIVDTAGLLLMVIFTAASVQDRDGGRDVIAKLAGKLPGVCHIWADGGDAGRLVSWARKTLAIAVEIVKEKQRQRGFEVLPALGRRTHFFLDHEVPTARLRRVQRGVPVRARQHLESSTVPVDPVYGMRARPSRPPVQRGLPRAHRDGDDHGRLEPRVP